VVLDEVRQHLLPESGVVDNRIFSFVRISFLYSLRDILRLEEQISQESGALVFQTSQPGPLFLVSDVHELAATRPDPVEPVFAGRVHFPYLLEFLSETPVHQFAVHFCAGNLVESDVVIAGFCAVGILDDHSLLILVVALKKRSAMPFGILGHLLLKHLLELLLLLVFVRVHVVRIYPTVVRLAEVSPPAIVLIRGVHRAAQSHEAAHSSLFLRGSHFVGVDHLLLRDAWLLGL